MAVRGRGEPNPLSAYDMSSARHNDWHVCSMRYRLASPVLQLYIMLRINCAVKYQRGEGAASMYFRRVASTSTAGGRRGSKTLAAAMLRRRDHANQL